MKTLDSLPQNAKLADVIARVNELVEAHNKSLDRRGPKSSREMTDEDARRVLPTGDLAAKSHKEAAEVLRLSYAQVYSCRGSYTFKHIHKEVAEKVKAPAVTE